MLALGTVLLVLGGWWAAHVSTQVAPDPPQIVLMSSPEADVYAQDGTHLGATPLVLQQGSVSGPLTLKRDGYKPRSVQLAFSDKRAPSERLVLEPKVGRVALEGLPGGTMISIDGEPATDVVERNLELLPGHHALEVLVPDEAPVALELEVDPSAPVDLAALVQEALAVRPRLTVKVEGPSKYRLVVWQEGADKLVREASGEAVVKLSKAGDYKVKVTADTFEPSTRSVKIEGPVELAVKLKKEKPKPAPTPAAASSQPYYEPPPAYYPPPSWGGGGGGGGGGHRISTPEF